MGRLKLKALEETRSFYKMELKKEALTERERNDYLKALKLIEKLIEKRKKTGKKGKHKNLLSMIEK
ncbi:unnamed protein product [marine sediment metagenome]|jgi:hypothetical protein|uniref:Uncharacterized protein n=1 Tax=marine sediment metagenome TaxID=412755 RepID=X1CPN8_9ZZZZ